MLSLKHCRRKLGACCTLEDEELEQVKDSLCSLAAVIISAFQQEQTFNPRGSEYKGKHWMNRMGRKKPSSTRGDKEGT